jgi:hypothetical protein
MKPTLLLLLTATTGLFSCGQTNQSKTDAVVSESFNSKRQYAYVDANGKQVIINNSLPKGANYNAANGKNYFRVIYWSSLKNETDSPLEMNTGFSEALYDFPAAGGKQYEILVPPDTMTTDKENLTDYGMIGLQDFLDNNFEKPSSIKRTILPKTSTGFYIVLLSEVKELKPGGTMRTGLHIKGQNLVYTISRYASDQEHTLYSVKKKLFVVISI